MVKIQVCEVAQHYVHYQTRQVTSSLQGVNLDVREGEFLSLVGPSGCGKTTLLRIIDGLVKASSGQILIDGRQVTKPGPDRAFVFQRGALMPWKTVLENVMFGLTVQGRGGPSASERGPELLKMVGLGGFDRHYPYQLSGGMQQRVNLARALAVEPQILLMDEPFSALDAQTRELMQQELLRIWETRKTTVIFVTHQIDEALFLSDRVACFTARPGRIKTVVDVPFARPRTLAVKRTQEFFHLTNQIRELLEEEVRQSAQLEGLK